MDFDYTGRYASIRERMRRVAETEIGPRAADADGRKENPEAIVKRLERLELTGFAVPEEYGGRGLDHLSHALAVMEVSGACASTGALMVANNSMYCTALTALGSPDQKRTYLVPCASGRKIGCYGLGEGEWGGEGSSLETVAVRDGEEWIVNGVKRFIMTGGLSSYCVLPAVTERGEGRNGISHFVLDLDHSPGVRIERAEETLGIRAVGTAEMLFENFRAPGEALLGPEGHGFRHMTTIMAAGWIGVAAQAVGIGRAVLEEAVAFAGTGLRYGRPLSTSQTVQWKLADSATELSAAELLTLRAAWLLDQGKPFEKEASMARICATEAAVKGAVEGVQILGADGFGRTRDMERHLRDAKMCQIWGGADEAARRVAAESLIRGN